MKCGELFCQFGRKCLFARRSEPLHFSASQSSGLALAEAEPQLKFSICGVNPLYVRRGLKEKSGVFLPLQFSSVKDWRVKNICRHNYPGLLILSVRDGKKKGKKKEIALALVWKTVFTFKHPKNWYGPEVWRIGLRHRWVWWILLALGVVFISGWHIIFMSTMILWK